MEHGVPQPMSLVKLILKAQLGGVLKKYSLKNFSLSELVPNGVFADYMFGYGQRPNPPHEQY